MKAWFTGVLEESGDYEAVLALNEAWPGLLTGKDLSDVEQKFEDYLRNETEYLTGSDSIDEIQTELDGLRSVAGGFGIDADEAFEQIQMHLDEVVAELDVEPDDDDWRERSDSEFMSGAREEQEIDSLFDSLDSAA